MLLVEDTVLPWLCLDSIEIQQNEKIGNVFNLLKFTYIDFILQFNKHLQWC